MAAATLLTGFIEGIITYNDGVAKALPFQDKIEGATFKYMGESLEVETFSALGIKGRSQACPFREECSMELMSKDLAWSFLQAATNTIANDATQRQPVTFLPGYHPESASAKPNSPETQYPGVSVRGNRQEFDRPKRRSYPAIL